MVRAFVLYEGETPDPARYEQHNRDFSSKVPGATFRHGEVFGAASASPSTSTTPSSSGRTWTVQGRHAQRRVRSGRQGRDGDGKPVQRLLRGVVTEPARPAPVDPAELGFERIVYEKAPPRATIRFNRPEVLNAFDFQMLRELARACEDASWDDSIRVVVLTGDGPSVLRRRRPQGVERGVPRQPDGVLEVVRRIQGRARPAARDRQADGGADQRDRRRRRQRAADGLRPGRDGGGRVHPPRRARARVGAGGRRDAVARRSWSATAAPARSSSCARRSRRARPRLGLVNSVVPADGAGRRGRRTGRKPGAQAPADDRYAKHT